MHLAVSARFPQSDLARVSGRALRLALCLAAQSQHAPFQRRLVDGQIVTVKPRQVLTSLRQLGVAGHGARGSILAALEELRTIGVIETTAITRSKTKTGSGQTSDRGRSKSRTTKCTVATLITVSGIRLLRTQSGSIIGPKREGTGSPLTVSEEQERHRAQQQLEAEGRWTAQEQP